MQLRLCRFAVALLLVLSVYVAQVPASSQIRAVAVPPVKVALHPEDAPQQTGLSLNLCVHDSTLYPCPRPVTLDNTYVPSITMTYGQDLDGAVVYSPDSLTFGTIILYQDPGAGPVPICVLYIGSAQPCPPGTTNFDAGDYTLTATLTFPGSFGYAPSSALPVVVSIAKDTSELALSSSQPVATLGSSVTISAKATGGYGAIPTGQIVFSVDGMPLDPIDLDATGVASFTTSALSLGTHKITASYAGAQNFYAAADPPTLKQQIVPPPTVTTVMSSLNPSSVGDKVTFTAEVSTVMGFAGTASGMVTFKDGTVAFGTSPVTLRNGQYLAQASVSTLAFGSHSITATYLGDGSTAGSVSPVLVQQVNYPLTQAPPGYRITVTPSRVMMGVGQTADLSITVTPISGFSQPVTLSCADLPTESACTFGDGVIQAGGGTTTLKFSTMAPHDCGSDLPYFTGQAALHHSGAPGSRHATPLLAGLLLLLLPRSWRLTRWMRPLLALAFACGLLAMNGCGGTCTDFGTPPGSYTFKVNGTAPGSSAVTGTASPVPDPEAVNVSTSVAITVKL